VAVVGSPAFLSPGASGGITAIIGTAPKGYGGANPTVYTSMADFVRDYGDPSVYPYPAWTLPQAAAALLRAIRSRFWPPARTDCGADRYDACG